MSERSTNRWKAARVVAIILAGFVLLLATACDTGVTPGEDTPAEETPSDIDSVLGSVVGSIGMNLPASLASTSSSSSSRTLDYSLLPEVGSEAYSHLLAHLETMEAQVTDLKNNLSLLRTDIIAGSDLQPDQTYEESFADTGETIRIKYSWVDVGDKTYLVVVTGTFDTASGTLKNGSYLEVEELANSAVAGQCMYTGDDGAGNSFRAKFDFDSSTGYMDAYYEMTSTTEGDESGQVRVIPDTEDTANGIEVAVKFRGESFGVHTQLGWANDNYGGVISVNDPDSTVADDEHLYTEIFAVDSGAGKVVYVENGQKTVDVMFERIDRGKQNLAGIVNAYSAGSTPPENLTLTYTWTPTAGSPDPAGYEIYSGLEATGTPLVTNTTDNPEGIWEVYWLDESVGTLTAGDSVYYLLSHDLTEDSGTYTGTSQFYKVSEVPATIDMFGETNFYVQGFTPVKYVTGTFADGDTLINRYELDYTGDGTADEFAYYIDISDDGSFNPLVSIEAGTDPDIPLLVWGVALDDSESPFIIGPIPDVSVPDGAGGTTGLTYEYADTQTNALGHLDEIAADQHISTISPPLFPVDGSDWKTISTADF